jgi:hypothetical protein
MKKKFLIGMAVLLSASLFFLGCGGGDDEPSSGGNDDNEPVTVDAFELGGFFALPVTDQPAATEFTTGADGQYDGAVAWDPAIVGGKYAATTEYTATVTLTAKGDYTLNGVGLNAFKYEGATSVANLASNGEVTVVFPKTGGTLAAPVAVDALELGGFFAKPATGGTPAVSFTGNSQYSGAIAWTKADDSTFTGNFEAGTSYKAVVTLTAKPTFTFNGVEADSFTYSGAASVTNAANTGVVTVVFPTLPGTSENPVVADALELAGSITAPVTGATPDTVFASPSDQYTGGTVAWTDEEEKAVSGAFAEKTVYVATVTLTPATGVTFEEAEDFEYDGATDIAQTAGTGTDAGKVTVTVTFGVTDTVVTALDLATAIALPKTGGTPDPAFASPDADQYAGGTVAWTDDANVAVEAGAKFASGKIYKATVTLTAEEDYTFATLAADSFTYAGANVVFAPGTGVVTVTFPVTVVGALLTAGFDYEEIPVAPVYTDVNNVKTLTLTAGTAEYDANLEWYLDGNDTALNEGLSGTKNVVCSLTVTDYDPAKKHTVIVTGTKDDVPASTSYTFTVAALDEAAKE